MGGLTSHCLPETRFGLAGGDEKQRDRLGPTSGETDEKTTNRRAFYLDTKLLQQVGVSE